MNPAPIGTRIQVLSNSNHHHYRIGGTYRVQHVEPDGNFKAIDDQGVEGDSLRWRDCRVIGLGWEWLRAHLDARSLDLLSAFDGVENLRMRQCVESRLITGIPNLAEAIRNKLPEVEAALRTCQEAANPSDDDDDDAILNSLLDE